MDLQPDEEPLAAEEAPQTASSTSKWRQDAKAVAGSITANVDDVSSKLRGVFRRRLSVNVENFANGATFEFGGEWFETGGWLDNRVERLTEHATLEFSSHSFLEGVSGYVWYHTEDHTANVVIMFSCPVTTATCFTARVEEKLPDCSALHAQVPEIARPGAGLRRSLCCAWETSELHDQHVEMRFLILSTPGPDPPERPGGPQVGQQLLRRLMKARLCKSVHADVPADNLQEFGQPSVVDRSVTVEVDNRSSEAFVYDGDWFEQGIWSMGAPVARMAPRSVTRLQFASNSFVVGVRGLTWFVNESSHDTYFSLVFSNPLAGDGSFNAWAGPPPPDLKRELALAPGLTSVRGVQVHQTRACAWNVMERGSHVFIRIAILQELAPIDLLAYPPQNLVRTSRESASTGVGSTAPHATETADVDGAVIIEEEDLHAQCGKVWTATRPRHVLDGGCSGLKFAGGGVMLGCCTLCAAPVHGAAEDGVAGFLQGLCKGIGAAIAATVGGTVLGVTQVARGIHNTPEACRAAMDGNKRWDTETATWQDDTTNLRQDFEQMPPESSEGEASDDEPESQREGGRPSRKVADTAYYDLIGVAPEAGQPEIKKRYYKAALRCHPDKNPDDPDASQHFQELAEAYQVLSDPKLREKYDKMGKEAVKDNGMPSVDPAIFFSMLFGSERFEKYTGKLYLAMQTDSMAKDLQKDIARRQKNEGREGQVPSPDVIADSMEREIPGFPMKESKRDKRIKMQQTRREVMCAVQLCERLDQWVIARDAVGFVNDTAVEASGLARVSFGGRLLRTIGTVYLKAAEQWFSSLRGYFTVGSQLHQLRETSHGAFVKIKAVSSIAQSALAFKKMHEVAGGLAMDGDDQEAKEEAQRQAMGSFEESLPLFLQMVWDISVVDIESTVRRICDKVLKDISVPWQLRYRRAQALQKLGRIFIGAGQMEHADLSQSSTVKQHLEEALHGSIRDRGG